MNLLNVAIVGCGLIGKRRAIYVAKDPQAKLFVVVDTDPKITASLKECYN